VPLELCVKINQRLL